jgi:hypothetical protein
VPAISPDASTKTLTLAGVVACHEPSACGIEPITESQRPALDAETLKMMGWPLLFACAFAVTAFAQNQKLAYEVATIKLNTSGDGMMKDWRPGTGSWRLRLSGHERIGNAAICARRANSSEFWGTSS